VTEDQPRTALGACSSEPKRSNFCHNVSLSNALKHCGTRTVVVTVFSHSSIRFKK
jgi:hypothetical protein